MKKKIFLLINLIVACSCLGQLHLEEYASHIISFEKINIKSRNGNFTIDIPADWKWETLGYPMKVSAKDYVYEPNNDASEIKIDSSLCIYEYKSKEEGYVNTLNIRKDSIRNGGLKDEYDLAVANNVQSSEFIFIESGKIKLSGRKCYYIQEVSDNDTFGKCEILQFLIPSKNKIEYFIITLIVWEKSDFIRMSKMITCLKTFKEL